MKVSQGNLFSPLPEAADDEHVELLHALPGLRLERIVSHGQASPPDFWYLQDQDEWVCLVSGEACLQFTDRPELRLVAGDWLTIPAGCRHRVAATSSPAVWLALFLPPAIVE